MDIADDDAIDDIIDDAGDDVDLGGSVGDVTAAVTDWSAALNWAVEEK